MARPPPHRRSGNPKSLAFYVMNFFRSRMPTPKTHRHLRMPSTPGVRDRSGRYRIFPARRQMHAKKNKYAMPRFDRTVAATTPVRPATRGHGRISHNSLFSLAPRWPSESAHRPTSRRYRVSYVGVTQLKLTEEPLFAGDMLNFCS